MAHRYVTQKEPKREGQVISHLGTGTEEVQMLSSIMRDFVFIEIPDLVNMRVRNTILRQTYNLIPNDTIGTKCDPRGDLEGIFGKWDFHGEGDKTLLDLIRPQPTIGLNYFTFEKAK